MPPENYHRVAILIETDDSWGRSVVEAIGKFARQQHWRLLIAPRDSQNRMRLPKKWRGDGVIVHLRTRALATHLRRIGLPTVDVSLMLPAESWLGRVVTDDERRAQMAIEHLRQRGLKHFACYAPPLGRYSDQRVQIFARQLQEAGFHCSMFGSKEIRQGWEVEHQHVMQWLNKLPRPLGVFAADPYPARQLAEICDLGGIRVPDEVAILAGDDDDLLCNLAWPRLSAVQLGCHALGTEAAKLLNKLMSGAAIPAKPKFIPPLRVCERHSTDMLAIADSELLAILRYIREHADQGLQVKQLVREFPVSRRSLEQRFREQLGRSPAEEIRRVRLERAKSMLLESSLAIADIARLCGFATSAHFSTAFQKQNGATPTAWRGQYA
ncbi:DNA-binding transcriptional regulator [Blastopirellula sp. J2-11]|uniref:AraC family transcriptional regulator n=1 Tax=Blastopirellula sp. J2-11 TaxID=2943192 RepID=UPI0021C7AFCE|nr:DNA-binding transcriptional regulator [Blastopirellula sp. J2-11]UUO09162.1 DNA-binding transcriptional regulator [Blastopirellula sp. J2-11]